MKIIYGNKNYLNIPHRFTQISIFSKISLCSELHKYLKKIKNIRFLNFMGFYVACCMFKPFPCYLLSMKLWSFEPHSPCLQSVKIFESHIGHLGGINERVCIIVTIGDLINVDFIFKKPSYYLMLYLIKGSNHLTIFKLLLTSNQLYST